MEKIIDLKATKAARERSKYADLVMKVWDDWEHADKREMLDRKAEVQINAREKLRIMTDAIRALKNRLDHRLDSYLVEMKEGYDDSITGFNEAWDIMRALFADIEREAARHSDPCTQEARDHGCTCRLSIVHSNDIDAPEPVIDRECPLHGNAPDPDYELERRRDDAADTQA